MSFDLIRALPYYTRLHVLSYLNKSEIVKCAQTHSKWKIFIEDSKVWREIAKQIFTYGTLNVPDVRLFLKEVAHQHLKSNSEILDRIRDFLNEVKVNQKAKCVCFLGQGSGFQTISIQILPGKITRDIIDDYRRYGNSEWEENNSEFDVTRNYFSPNLSDGNLPASSIPRDKLQNSNYIFAQTVLKADSLAFFSMDSHKACVRFPWQLYSSELFKRIKGLVTVRIDQLESEKRDIKKRDHEKIKIIALLILAIYFSVFKKCE